MKKILIYLCLLCVAFVVQAQCYEETVRKADSAYFNLEFKRAKALYEQALECPDASSHNYGLSAFNGAQKCKEKLGATLVVNTKIIVGKPSVSGVDDSGNVDEGANVFIEEEASFPGGWDAYFEYLKKNLRYPDLARDNNISGTVVVQFVIDKDGSVYKAEVIRDIGGGCGQEVLRVIKAMPKWNPAKHNGKPVRSAFNQPVIFILE